MRKPKYPYHSFPPARKAVKFWLEDENLPNGLPQGFSLEANGKTIFKTENGLIFDASSKERSCEPIIKKQAFFH
jgi:hypothetical protein